MPLKKYARKRVFRKKTTKTSKPVVSKAVKAYVKRSINVAAENKQDYRSLGADLSNIIGAAPSYLISVLPNNIAQSTDQGGRVGNSITPVKSTIRLSLNMRDYSSLTNTRQLSQMVTIMVFKLKAGSFANVTPSYTDFFSRMFQFGNSASGLANTPMDHLRTINKDLFTVKWRKTFKLGYASPVGGGASGTGISPVPSNDFDYHRFVTIPNVQRWMKKSLKFDDATRGNTVTNDNLWMCAFCAPVDGSFFTSTPIRIEGDQHTEYQDQ